MYEKFKGYPWAVLFFGSAHVQSCWAWHWLPSGGYNVGTGIANYNAYDLSVDQAPGTGIYCAWPSLPTDINSAYFTEYRDNSNYNCR